MTSSAGLVLDRTADKTSLLRQSTHVRLVAEVAAAGFGRLDPLPPLSAEPRVARRNSVALAECTRKVSGRGHRARPKGAGAASVVFDVDLDPHVVAGGRASLSRRADECLVTAVHTIAG